MKGVRMTDRKLNGALAKPIVDKQCGVVRLLEGAEILNHRLRPLDLVESEGPA